MAITAKQLQESCNAITDQEIADLQVSLAGSVGSLIRETLQPAFSKIADSAGKVLGAQFADVASSARRIMDELQAEVRGNIQELQLYVPLDRPVRTLEPLSWLPLEVEQIDTTKFN